MPPITVITGSRKGIGRHLAERYAAAGHVVVGISRGETEASFDNYEHLRADVGDENAVTNVFSMIRKRHGRIDHLINAAGIASMNHSLLTPGKTVRDIFDTNVLGTFLCVREAAKTMQRHKYGRIVNFSSIAVPLKIAGESVYAASKSAVETLSAVMAREVAPLGITVNVVAPGPVDTDLIRGVSAARIDSVVAQQAITRRGTFDDVANVVDFFLSEHSGFITGQTIYLGGV
jgi:3-oxoacyl-[acyl-carrier protein] reductase